MVQKYLSSWLTDNIPRKIYSNKSISSDRQPQVHWFKASLSDIMTADSLENTFGVTTIGTLNCISNIHIQICIQWTICTVSKNIFLLNDKAWYLDLHCQWAYIWNSPDSKVNGFNMGPTWVLSVPGRPHVGPMNLAIRECIQPITII